MAWIHAIWRPGQEGSDPERILIAGCGTGAEALAVRGRFPLAEIVAIDFSPRSIAIADQLQRRRRPRNPVRFLVADLGVRGLERTVGRHFDFVSCHGVLTYVPEPARALENLARCLAPDGALYLGANGSRHRSVPLRAALPAVGFDTARFVDGPAVREVLAMLDAILATSDRTARESAPYLASDVFGPFFQNLPLSDWIDIGRRAGLHFHGSLASHFDLRPAVTKGLCGLLVPRSRVEVAQLLDLLRPAPFHRLVFARQPPANPPWADSERLLTWRPVLSTLYRSRLPAPSRSGSRTVIFRSPATNTHVRTEMSPWQVELLREGDGARSIGRILRSAGVEVSPDALLQHLYVLHQLLVIDLLPPARRSTPPA
jgi:SAM-dependent methyltransferase